MLGDDALACLRDLKRWLKLYDEKTNRLDVARCLAEANFVNGDLLPILASWPDDGKEYRLKSRVALGCCECIHSFGCEPGLMEDSGVTCASNMADGNQRDYDSQSPSTYAIPATSSSSIQERDSEL